MSNTTLQGWSRGAWNDGPWNQITPVVIQSGVSGTAATTTPGQASVYSVSGLAGTSALGSVTMSLITPVDVTSVSGTASVGSQVAIGATTATPSGVSATGSVESVAGTGNFVVSITNTGLTSGLGKINIWENIAVSQTPNWTEIAA
tara:strand:+ start:228 stop:665 length:438 start_codon:yes stop_codon:yes gene_type:complete